MSGYARYRAGSLKPTTDEAVQIGDRLAHLLRHCVREMPGYERVEAVDDLPR